MAMIQREETPPGIKVSILVLVFDFDLLIILTVDINGIIAGIKNQEINDSPPNLDHPLPKPRVAPRCKVNISF